jgi:hypothetical protein
MPVADKEFDWSRVSKHHLIIGTVNPVHVPILLSGSMDVIMGNYFY